MPVFIQDFGVVDKLEAVEGAKWRFSEGGEKHVSKLVKAWMRYKKMMTESGDTLKATDSPILEDDNGSYISPVLYGAAGWSRYVVKGDGELVLLGDTTRVEKIDKAIDMGFSVRGRPGYSMQDNPGLFILQSILGVGVLAAIVMAVISWRGNSSFASGILVGGTRTSPGPGRTAVVGDSIVANTSGFVRFLGSNVPGRAFDNMGVVGEGTSDIHSRMRRNVIGSSAAGRYDEVIIEGGVNDLGQRSPVEYVTNNLRSMVQEARSAGLKVVLLTVTPYYAGAAVIQQINDVIKRDGRGWGAEAVVDTWTPLADSSGGLKQEYVGDQMHLHPNNAGQLLMGRTILAAAYR